MEWMLMPYRRYADFSGRSRRMEYWMFHLFFYALLIVSFMAAIALGDIGRSANDDGPGLVATAIFGLMGLFFLGSIIPLISVTVRRFHDQGYSGWLFPLNFIPSIGGLIVFVFMLLEGNRGENQYGPDPKNPGFDPDVFA